MNLHSRLPRLRCVLLLLLAVATPALAADGTQSLQQLRDAAVQAVALSLPPSAQLSANALDERLRLPACTAPLRSVPAEARGGQVNVAVQCEAPVAWSVYVGVKISDIRPVLVLSRSAQRGETLDRSLLSLQERDVGSLPFGYLTDLGQIQGQLLRRAASAGSVLTPELVEAPRLVRRGDLVTVTARTGGIEIRTQGKAMRDGVRGERIPVENASSRRVVEGQVTGSGQVEVAL